MEERKELLKNRQIMRFKCILCGRCCSDPKTLINVTFRDILRIKKFLNIQIQDILKYIGFYTFKDEKIEKYLEKMLYTPVITENGQAFIALLKKENGDCIFLDHNKKCSIYEHRPKICQCFPFTFDLKEKSGINAELDITYTFKGIEFCPGISKKAPIIKKKKYLELITETLLEMEADTQIINNWNNLVQDKKIQFSAAKYIVNLAKFEDIIKDINLESNLKKRLSISQN